MTTEFLIGKRERISLVAETSHGSGGDMAANGWVPGYDCIIEPGFKLDWQELLSAGEDSRKVADRVTGKKNLPFTLRFTPYNWRWLKFMMAVANGGTVGAYTHTFTLANTLTSFKLEWAKRHTTAHVLTLIGCYVRNARISYTKATGPGKEGLVQIVCECVAKDVTPGSSVSTLAGGNPTAAPLRYRAVKLTLAGSEVVEVNSGEMFLDNEVDPEDGTYCNSTLDDTIGELVPKTFRCTGSNNINIKDKTIFDLWNTKTDLTGTNTLEFTKAVGDALVATFSKIQLDNGTAPTNLEGITNLEVPYWADGFTSLVETNATEIY